MAETIAVGTDIEIIPNLPESLPSNDEFSSPIVIRPVEGKLESSGDDVFNKTALAGSLECDDTRDDSMMIFITAYRDGNVDNISHHYAGYGVALRMLTEEGITDSKLNLFIVDNSLADRDVILENVLHTGWGDYAYLASTSIVLSANTQYNYQLKYLENGGIDFYIWASGGTIPVNPSISYGAYSNIQSSGIYYGVSCSNTGGYQTVVKSLSLANLDASYPMIYCHINGVDMPSTFSLVASAWAEKSDLSSKGIYMRVCNHATNPPHWDTSKIAYHAFGAGSGDIQLELDGLTRGEHQDDDHFVDVLLVSEFASDFAADVDVTLFVDDTYIETYSEDIVHIGGDSDAWIHDSDGLSLMEFDIYNIGVKEWLLSSNSKITGDFWLPVMLIKEIVSIDSSGIETGVLVPVADWDFSVYKEDWRFSAREENFVTFRVGLIGTNVRIKFHTAYKIMAADLMLQSHLNEPNGYDILARGKVPYEVFIEADIVASIQPSAIMGHIYDYITAEDHETIEDTDINIYLQAQDGISDANVTLIYALKHSMSGTVTTISSVGGVLSLENPDIDQFIAINDTVHNTLVVS